MTTNSPLGLGLESDEPNPVIYTSNSKHSKPKNYWAGITENDIGAGYAAVDISVFDKPKDLVYETKDFKNKFVSGKSKAITYTVRPKLTSRSNQKKKSKPFNENTKVSKDLKKKFAASLSTSINTWRTLFVKEILPVTLAIQSAAEEIKEQTSQLVDESVPIPADYIKVKALQAVQIRILRSLKEQFKLTDEEATILAADFLPKLTK